ncbi:DUF1540 domain-containing protein [Amorphoplanes digitatis]|uniref:DUF1540 domain-containing protein n=1 Tax=Actinoplanes digitatis TaxID=1868 RepID=A0A7W7HUJ0_9ACTN|nr:DUF1540 domain-containing protein [Actinoplanes digitatis]MBB4760994.1 hypothetical protein [Actinoplanes digitatis]BFE69315.1 DUF1540 domain-containing protein [Actinoplanes digitatis]GID95303.1 hypothetical protein Adi01nite_47150 [Actinoplanes digitatis]
MTQMLEMPRVQTCTVTACGYNHGGCTAFAITIGGVNSACDTFVETTDKGGMGQATAQVGACKRSECVHNTELECHAPSIVVGAAQDRADCLTFEAR